MSPPPLTQDGAVGQVYEALARMSIESKCPSKADRISGNLRQDGWMGDTIMRDVINRCWITSKNLKGIFRRVFSSKNFSAHE